MAEDLVIIKLFEEAFAEYEENSELVGLLALDLRNLFRIFSLQASNCGDPKAKSTLLSAEKEMVYHVNLTSSTTVTVKYQTIVTSANVTAGIIRRALQPMNKPLRISVGESIEAVGTGGVSGQYVFTWTASCVLSTEVVLPMGKALTERNKEQPENIEEILERQKAQLEADLDEQDRVHFEESRASILRKRGAERRSLKVKPIDRIVVKTKRTEKEREAVLRRYGAPKPAPQSVLGALWAFLTNKKQQAPTPTSFGESYALDEQLFIDGTN